MVKISCVLLSASLAIASALPRFSHLLFEEFGSAHGDLVPNHCIPETTMKEYHPFQLESHALKSFLSKHSKSNLLVGGFPNGNRNFEYLELCIVSSDYGCSTTIQSACIYQNIEYRFRVNSPVQGYLRIEDEQLRIVPDFDDGSELILYRDKDRGLRIAYLDLDGSRSALETTTPGRAVILAEPELDNDRQWFEIIANNIQEPRW